MRILILSNMYPPHHLGGYEQSCRDTVRRWRRMGHEVRVLTSDLELTADPVDEDPDVRRALRIYWQDYEIVRPRFRQRLEIERHNQTAFREIAGGFEPDVVSVWNMGAMSLGLLTTAAEMGLPTVLVVCDDWLVYARHLDAWTRTFRWKPLRRLARRLFGLPVGMELDPEATATCFISKVVAGRAEHDKPMPHATVAYNGIDTTDFPLRQPELKPWRSELLYVGRVEQRKGVHVAIAALSHLPDATLTIDGPIDDSYQPRVRELIERLGVADRVRFVLSKRSELADRYVAADVLLFPVVWAEPFGLVPLEAMACGTPVVATGTGGSGEFLFDGVNCLLAPPGDAEATSSAVERLAADADMRLRIQRAGYMTAAQLNADIYAETLEAWHQAAAGRFAGGEPEARIPLEELLASLR